ncbi:unnamed protein product [Acidithrix sp. C25]|nr:unnamed protein product [Acidithrix sp. C25]
MVPLKGPCVSPDIHASTAASCHLCSSNPVTLISYKSIEFLEIPDFVINWCIKLPATLLSRDAGRSSGEANFIPNQGLQIIDRFRKLILREWAQLDG